MAPRPVSIEETRRRKREWVKAKRKRQIQQDQAQSPEYCAQEQQSDGGNISGQASQQLPRNAPCAASVAIGSRSQNHETIRSLPQQSRGNGDSNIAERPYTPIDRTRAGDRTHAEASPIFQVARSKSQYRTPSFKLALFPMAERPTNKEGLETGNATSVRDSSSRSPSRGRGELYHSPSSRRSSVLASNLSDSAGRRQRSECGTGKATAADYVKQARESPIPEIAGLNLHDGPSTAALAVDETLQQDVSDAPSGSVYTPSSPESVVDTSIGDNHYGFRPSPTPGTPTNTASGFAPEVSGNEPGVTYLSLQSSPATEDEDSAFLRWAGYRAAPTTSQPSNAAADPVVIRYMQAAHRQETRGGPDFLDLQAKVYDEIFQKVFGLQCDCSEPRELGEPQGAHTLNERTQYLQQSLPSLADVFSPTGSYDPRAYFRRWCEFLSHQPTEPLSFRKTQSTIGQPSVTIAKKNDIDSCWVAPKTLEAIQAPNDFRLTFLPRFSLNLSTDQVVQPHGLDLARTRHIPLGTFQAGSVRFQVFVFFPKSADNPRSITSASSNALSLERQKDFYDQIVIPAAYESIEDPERQEIPRSFSIVYAKSHTFQEKPSISRWSADDDSRAHQLSFTIPARSLGRFWASVVERSDSVKVKTQRGVDVAYFERPRLLFQAHDLKNTFASPSLNETLGLFRDTVMAALNPEYLDMRSCWIDIGARYYVTGLRGRPLAETEAYTLEWKSQCNRSLHERLEKIAPESNLMAAYYRSFALRDVGNLVSKTKRTSAPNIGHPDSRKLGVCRFKAYDCGKDLFKDVGNKYCLFSSPSLPQLALDQNMIQDLDSMTKSRANMYTSQHSRESIFRAWEANKRHIKAISDPHALTNYGIRKEATFRLDTILTMWNDGYFDPERSPHAGPICLTVPLDPGPDEHYPFWIVPTRDMNALIFTQAARLIVPLDHLFQEASLPSTDQSSSPVSHADRSIRRIFAFYTAQLLCRLLEHAFSSEREFNYDNWIWCSDWRVPQGLSVAKVRTGLGLREPIDKSGMLWIPPAIMDWRRGHLALATLVELHIPRSPLQIPLASQANIQALTTTQLTVEFLLQEWIHDARQAFDAGQREEGQALAARVIKLAAEEIARSYNQHLLCKIRSYWERVRVDLGRNILPSLSRLLEAEEDVAADRSRIVTAQTVRDIYMQAWDAYSLIVNSDELETSTMPSELPCWMTTRKYLPPKDSWSGFVFSNLFSRPDPPKWDRITFLRIYRTFKAFWEPISAYMGSFDGKFKRIIGRCIMVTFNSDQGKEVGTNRTRGTWYDGQPSFFQMQYWAPYFSPPESNRKLRVASIPGQVDVSHDAAPTIPSAQEFHNLQSWLDLHRKKIMARDDELCAGDLELLNRRYREILRRLVQLSGPAWIYGPKRLYHVVPWKLGSNDSFRVPGPRKHVSERLLSQPTVLLPTRDNVMSLIDAMKSLPDLDEKSVLQFKWAMTRLHNDGKQYSIRSHLESKKVASAELSDQSPSLLQQFLAQTEPPERFVTASRGVELEPEAGDIDIDTDIDIDIDMDEDCADADVDGADSSDDLASLAFMSG
ncbi:hypothetical protein VFPPC_12036 [Pochonia chlamydosporia 170]|uniref:Uncharacterized protein n=1 Tax=Pochonia chlamydosporia 170 TaxID=1380566 RepID=A0A179G385_METCM|nr:hypothetical protein VFPPC_12036 [Pochonia chlamydosporia 170]OAQ71918.1 hypothetical protein VFPPC_12036 [Pochonia chlamydosporia 170]